MTEFELPQSLLALATEVERGSHNRPHRTARRPRSSSLREMREQLDAHEKGELQPEQASPGVALCQVRALLERVMPQQATGLLDEDLKILALLFNGFMQHNRHYRALSLARDVDPEGVNCLGILERIRKLVSRGLVEAEADGPPQQRRSAQPMDRVQLADSCVQLHHRFLHQVIGDPMLALDDRAAAPIESNEQFLQQLLDYSRQLRLHQHAPMGEAPGCLDASLERTQELDQAWNKLLERIDGEARAIPFLRIVERCQLNSDERNILVYLFDEKANGHDCSVSELCHVIGEHPLHALQCKSYFAPRGRLVRHGLITVDHSDHLGPFHNQVCLAPSALDEIIGSRQDTGGDEGSPLNPQGLLQEWPVKRGWRELVLPPALDKQLELVLGRFEQGVPDTLRRWGLLQAADAHQTGGHSGAAPGFTGSLRLLFSGPSGTGKTLCAEACAQRLGGRLLVTDMSRILSKWVGESQQNVSAVFDEYTQLAQQAERTPILLLDECDQFLLQRMAAIDSGSDRMHHEMQNLFLDRLERFQGIVIATTNLVEAIDPAFSRRFDYKLVFPEPGIREREQIWHRHLPAGVPLLEELDFNRLAREFPFSGGQIAISLRNAVLEAATRGDGLCMRDLVDAANVEQKGALQQTGRRSVGFIQSDAA